MGSVAGNGGEKSSGYQAPAVMPRSEESIRFRMCPWSEVCFQQLFSAACSWTIYYGGQGELDRAVTSSRCSLGGASQSLIIEQTFVRKGNKKGGLANHQRLLSDCKFRAGGRRRESVSPERSIASQKKLTQASQLTRVRHSMWIIVSFLGCRYPFDLSLYLGAMLVKCNSHIERNKLKT